jgi:hypothetical protein
MHIISFILFGVLIQIHSRRGPRSTRWQSTSYLWQLACPPELGFGDSGSQFVITLINR